MCVNSSVSLSLFFYSFSSSFVRSFSFDSSFFFFYSFQICVLSVFFIAFAATATHLSDTHKIFPPFTSCTFRLGSVGRSLLSFRPRARRLNVQHNIYTFAHLTLLRVHVILCAWRVYIAHTMTGAHLSCMKRHEHHPKWGLYCSRRLLFSLKLRLRQVGEIHFLPIIVQHHVPHLYK